jgi:Secretion system C-terminal sorting domain
MKKYIGLITAFLPLMASAQMVVTGSTYVVMTGGTAGNPTSLVLTNAATTAIKNTGTGWIVSENEFNQVDWPIGTNTGSYVVPFGLSNTDYIPLTCDITAAGVGSGVMKFATYHGSSWDNTTYKPSDVTTMSDFGSPDYSLNTVDRFWIMDAETGYTTKPAANSTFTYVRSGAGSDIAAPNYIVETTLIAQRFNTSSDQWNDFYGTTHTDATTSNTGTVSSGIVSAANFYRSWSLFNDSAEITSVPEVNVKSAITVYPNPGNGNFTVAGLTTGQVVEMYNYLGQLLTSAVADNSTTMHFNISTYANGMYLMRIQNKDGSGVIEKKIVKTQ